jgi:hypothetical protein
VSRKIYQERGLSVRPKVSGIPIPNELKISFGQQKLYNFFTMIHILTKNVENI